MSDKSPTKAPSKVIVEMSNPGVPSMFASSVKTKPRSSVVKKPATKKMQDKVGVFEQEKKEEKWVPNKPTMELHGAVKGEEEVVTAPKPAPTPTPKEEEKPAPKEEPKPVTRRVSTTKTEEANPKASNYFDQQATPAEENIVLTESYKQERAAKRAERRATLEAKLAEKEERKQKLEEALAANKAVAFATALLKDNTTLSPEYRARVAEHNRREEESRKKREEQKARLEEKFGPMHEKLKERNMEAEEYTAAIEAKEQAWREKKEKEKKEKEAKKAEQQRKKEEYEKRRDARRADS